MTTYCDGERLHVVYTIQVLFENIFGNVFIVIKLYKRSLTMSNTFTFSDLKNYSLEQIDQLNFYNTDTFEKAFTLCTLTNDF